VVNPVQAQAVATNARWGRSAMISVLVGGHPCANIIRVRCDLGWGCSCWPGPSCKVRPIWAEW